MKDNYHTNLALNEVKRPKAHLTSWCVVVAQKWVGLCAAVSLIVDESWRWQTGGVLGLRARSSPVVRKIDPRIMKGWATVSYAIKQNHVLLHYIHKTYLRKLFGK
uniref:(California timema) hypothetical protein n=1 Tax=Timema californicum TaxID=61474 RepID=A0A7R9J327_TIMCA|nr:unnamed protein product [Timema californicum]